jgi:hypothetical protein
MVLSDSAYSFVFADSGRTRFIWQRVSKISDIFFISKDILTDIFYQQIYLLYLLSTEIVINGFIPRADSYICISILADYCPVFDWYSKIILIINIIL